MDLLYPYKKWGISIVIEGDGDRTIPGLLSQASLAGELQI